jgi:hypothetical protein
MHATQIKTRAETEQAVSRIAGAHLNAVFLLVWYWGGQAFYQTDLCAPGAGIEPGHDPLGAVQLERTLGSSLSRWTLLRRGGRVPSTAPGGPITRADREAVHFLACFPGAAGYSACWSFHSN